MSRRTNVIAVFLVCAAAFAALWPALRAGFVNWDDAANLLANFHYRGLGWTQLHWMLTTTFGGCYQPLAWLSYALDYSIWGLNPLGFHLTNLALHAIGAVLFYFAAARLLRAGAPEAGADRVSWAAAFAALFFAVHPLRAESVAWITERRDVLSGVFYLACLLFYLRRELKASLACFVLALSAKASGAALPAVFLILDVYPLRRLSAGARGRLAPERRPVLLEKIPFLFFAAVFGAAAFAGQRASGALISLGRAGLAERFRQALVGLAFYPVKTFIPIHLSPLYEMPQGFRIPSIEVWTAGAFVLILSAVFWSLRKKWPAALAAWACYLILILPLSGLFPLGRELAADRYSYLSCLPWAVLVGAATLAVSNRLGRAGQKILFAGAAAFVCGLGILTWRQSEVWRSSKTLWGRVVALNPNSDVAHDGLGLALAAEGKPAQAAAQYEAALAINPGYAKAHNNLGDALAAQGQTARAVAEYQDAIRLDPGL
ncbi:MAG: tetratricopeptide repeat protein, partial [Elusimicrobia bacterium]|nr:tetratricopeptide repeat protein [Elusimicrobiota bacterium]